MNILFEHLYEQGITYTDHLVFAIGISRRLMASVLAFAVHALLPFIPIEKPLDLEATAAFLEERNRFIEDTAARHPDPGARAEIAG